MRGRGFLSLILFSVVALIFFSTSDPAWSKKHHSVQKPSDPDPCAAPRAYVSDHINRIKALQATPDGGNASLFNMLGGRSDVDERRSAQISELRYDADGVNALLQAGGCKAFDLDHELAPAGK